MSSSLVVPFNPQAENNSQHTQDIVAVSAATLTYSQHQNYTPAERDVLETGRMIRAVFESGTHSTFNTGTKLTSAWKASQGDCVLVCVRATIRTSAEEMLAFLMDVPTNYMAAMEADDPNTIKEEVHRVNHHSNFVYAQYHAPYPLADRELVVTSCWESIGPGSYLLYFPRSRLSWRLERHWAPFCEPTTAPWYPSRI